MEDITLPRDAEGREIPLDTKVLYDKSGNKRKVQGLEYSPIGGRWKVTFLDSFADWYEKDVYLTPRDSWKKLLEDLDNAAEKASNNYINEPCCEWFNDGGRGCTGCPADESPDDSCNVQLVKNIAARIRRLRGEGEDE